MDPILQRLDAIRWTYSDRDPATVAELARRIAEIGRTPTDFLIYSDLVDGVEFHLPNVNDGRPFEIVEWTDLNRAIIGCREIISERTRDKIAATPTQSVAGAEVLHWDAYPPPEQARLMRLLVERVDYDGPAGKLTIAFHEDGRQRLLKEQEENYDA